MTDEELRAIRERVSELEEYLRVDSFNSVEQGWLGAIANDIRTLLAEVDRLRDLQRLPALTISQLSTMQEQMRAERDELEQLAYARGFHDGEESARENPF